MVLANSMNSLLVDVDRKSRTVSLSSLIMEIKASTAAIFNLVILYKNTDLKVTRIRLQQNQY